MNIAFLSLGMAHYVPKTPTKAFGVQCDPVHRVIMMG
jgi:hypothetical protein